jgi:hypothetical protein
MTGRLPQFAHVYASLASCSDETSPSMQRLYQAPGSLLDYCDSSGCLPGQVPLKGVSHGRCASCAARLRADCSPPTSAVAGIPLPLFAVAGMPSPLSVRVGSYTPKTMLSQMNKVNACVCSSLPCPPPLRGSSRRPARTRPRTPCRACARACTHEHISCASQPRTSASPGGKWRPAGKGSGVAPSWIFMYVYSFPLQVLKLAQMCQSGQAPRSSCT